MSALLYILLAAFLFICLVLILLVLIQKGRGGGLASAFGGGGGNTAFGSKTGDVLTWATSIVFGVFLALAVVLNLVANKIHARATGIPGSPAPAAQTTPVTIPGTTDAPPAVPPANTNIPVETAPAAPGTQPGN